MWANIISSQALWSFKTIYIHYRATDCRFALHMLHYFHCLKQALRGIVQPPILGNAMWGTCHFLSKLQIAPQDDRNCGHSLYVLNIVSISTREITPHALTFLYSFTRPAFSFLLFMCWSYNSNIKYTYISYKK